MHAPHPSTPGSTLDARLGGLDTVELAELLDVAELLTRRDRKYVLSGGDPAGVAHLVGLLSPAPRVLEISGRRAFRYASTYFDTAELDCYRAASRGRPLRFKVRTREYLDSGACSLEVKRRDRQGRTVKERLPYDPDDAGVLTADGRAFIGQFDEIAPFVALLRPALTTCYNRSTLLLPCGSRLTVDLDLTFVTPDGCIRTAGCDALVETKSAGRATTMDHALWSAGERPVSVSKYCAGLALAHPHLPANRWNRVLRTRFDWHPQRPDFAAA